MTGSLASTVGTYNPIRYRGYVYDTETELYYLNSRYYNPEWGRYINADIYISTGQGLTGANMFAYCGNDPVNNLDPTGECAHYWFVFGTIDCEKCRASKPNCSKEQWYDIARNSDGSISLHDSKRFDYSNDRIFREQILVLEASPAQINFDVKNGEQPVVSLGSVSLTAYTGGWEFEHLDLSLLDFGRAEAALEYKEGNFKLSAMASIWVPSAEVSIGRFKIGIEYHVGAIGIVYEKGEKVIKAGGTPLGGTVISVSW